MALSPLEATNKRRTNNSPATSRADGDEVSRSDPSDESGRRADTASSTGNSDRLWQRLADEMRAARQRAGVRPGAWADDPEVLWTRSHISNLEHGRGRPPEELVELYDRRFPNPQDPLFLQRLRAQAERVSAQSDVPEASLQTPAAPAPPRARRRPLAPIAAVTAAAALACVVAIVLLAFGGNDSRHAAVPPVLGSRTVCARDLRVRSAPQADLDEAEPQLTRGDGFVVDRYVKGDAGPHEWAHGTSDASGHTLSGWVLASWLCR